MTHAANENVCSKCQGERNRRLIEQGRAVMREIINPFAAMIAHPIPDVFNNHPSPFQILSNSALKKLESGDHAGWLELVDVVEEHIEPVFGSRFPDQFLTLIELLDNGTLDWISGCRYVYDEGGVRITPEVLRLWFYVHELDSREGLFYGAPREQDMVPIDPPGALQ